MNPGSLRPSAAPSATTSASPPISFATPRPPLRVFLYSFSSLQTDWVWVLWVLAVLTMTLGNLAALHQTSFRRLLAYSAVAHTGYALLGLLTPLPGGLAATTATADAARREWASAATAHST